MVRFSFDVDKFVQPAEYLAEVGQGEPPCILFVAPVLDGGARLPGDKGNRGAALGFRRCRRVSELARSLELFSLFIG